MNNSPDFDLLAMPGPGSGDLDMNFLDDLAPVSDSFLAEYLQQLETNGASPAALGRQGPKPPTPRPLHFRSPAPNQANWSGADGLVRAAAAGTGQSAPSLSGVPIEHLQPLQTLQQPADASFALRGGASAGPGFTVPTIPTLPTEGTSVNLLAHHVNPAQTLAFTRSLDGSGHSERATTTANTRLLAPDLSTVQQAASEAKEQTDTVRACPLAVATRRQQGRWS